MARETAKKVPQPAEAGGDDLYDLPPEWLKNGGGNNESLTEGCYDERTLEPLARGTEYDVNTMPDAKNTGKVEVAAQPAAETRRPGGGIRRGGGGGAPAPKADEEAFKLTEEYHPVGHSSNDDKVGVP